MLATRREIATKDVQGTIHNLDADDIQISIDSEIYSDLGILLSNLEYYHYYYQSLKIFFTHTAKT